MILEYRQARGFTMASKKTKPKSKNSVPVELEKLDEQNTKKRTVQMVSDEVVASIRNVSQIEEDAIGDYKKRAFKNKVLFYSGVAAAVGIGYLVHRYYFSVPTLAAPFVQEVVNGAVSVVPQ